MEPGYEQEPASKMEGPPPAYAPPPQGPPPVGFVQQPYPQGGPVPGIAYAQQATVVTSIVALGPSPSTMVCPSCHNQMTTDVRHEAGTKTHLMALLMCLLGCWCCCCIPYCTDSCMTANHYCPNCQAYLGSYNA